MIGKAERRLKCGESGGWWKMGGEVLRRMVSWNIPVGSSRHLAEKYFQGPGKYLCTPKLDISRGSLIKGLGKSNQGQYSILG